MSIQLAFASRVHQVEANIIDQECKNILKDLLKKSFLLSMPRKLNDFTPEINLIIDFMFYSDSYFRFTLAQDQALPGQTLQNLIFSSVEGGVPNRKSKILYFIIIVLGEWLWKRLMIYSEKNHQKAHKAFSYIEMFYKIRSFAHYCYFIGNFDPSTVYNYKLQLCQLRLLQKQPGITRELDFDFLIRTVVWRIFSRIFSGFMSSVGLSSIKKLFMMSSFLGSIEQQNNGNGCFVCKQKLKTMPVRVEPCGHEFCYYCFKSQVNNDKCPQCQEIIQNSIDIVK